MTDKITLFTEPAELAEGILDHQVEKCPTCGNIIDHIGYGLAGGGIGTYGFCTHCTKVVWKCLSEDQ